MNALKSGLVSAGGNILLQLVSLIGTIVLARLLTPEEFGIYGYCFAVFLFFQAFLDFGITPIYIKLDHVDERINSSFLAVNAFCGVAVALVLILLAPIVARYFELPILRWMLYLQATIPILQSLSNQPFGQLQRKKKFVQAEITTVGANISAMSVGIITAWLGHGPWALLYKQLGFAVVRLLGALGFSRAKYHLISWQDIKNIRTHIMHAGNLTASRLATGISGNLEKLLVGKVFGEQTLGHYNQALFVTDKPNILAHALITPALAYMARMDSSRYGESYALLTKGLLTLVGIPCLFFFLYGDVLTTTFLGDQWTEAGQYVIFLCFLGVSLIMKGISNVILVNEHSTKDLLMYNVWSLVIIYPLALAILFYYHDMYRFVQLFSLISLAFWFGILARCLVRFGRDRHLVRDTLVYIISLGVIFLGIGVALKSWLSTYDWSIWLEIISVFVLAGLLTFVIMRLLFPRQVGVMLRFISERLPS